MNPARATAPRARIRLVGAAILAAACGCAPGVHFVSRSPDGGVVAIPNNSDQWPTHYRSRAEQLMKKACPNGYVIDREEVVVEKPARSGKQAPNDDAYYDYNGGLERIDSYRRESYQITFHTAPSGGWGPKTDAPPQAGQPNSPTLPPSAPGDVDKDELPPPRPLKGAQE